MNINELKKELGLSNSDIAKFFGLTPMGYANSSAKKRYEAALVRFYEHIERDRKRTAFNPSAINNASDTLH